jgi:hypothetical protein
VIRTLLVGDVVAKAGRKSLLAHLESLVDRERVDFVVVNVENAANGFGVTLKVMEELDCLPVNVWTTGNHVWDRKEALPLLDTHPWLLRPSNYPDGNPGRGWCVAETAAGVPVAVLHLQGQALMPPVNNPFWEANRVLEALALDHPEVKVILVDLHAETTSEKQAMGWFLDGRVTAVLGTHTHVPTADERILPSGTAFLTDVGMTGPYDSVIGMQPERAMERFLYNTPRQLEPASRGAQLRGVIVDADPATGKALAIRRVRLDGP